jgi:hypothetical protein
MAEIKDIDSGGGPGSIKSPLDGTERVEIQEAAGGVGSTKQTTTQALANLAGSGVTSVSGTTNRITSTGGATPVIDIDAAYDAAITTAIGVVNTALSNHISDATDAHAGTAITNTPAGNITATTVQAALNELDSEKQAIANPASSLTDGGSIAITGAKHTLTTTQSAVTFSQSFTGDFSNIDVTFNTTAATWTFASGSLCVVEGSASGDNTATISAVSGDKIVISIWFVSSGNYRVAVKNFGQ